MTDLLYQAHSGWRYIIIVLGLIVIVKYLVGWLGKRQWSRLDQQLGLAFPVAIDVQWLLGIVLWLTGMDLWFSARNVTFWEHLVTMTLALAVAHIGWARVKKTDDALAKFRTGAIFFIIAGLLLALGVMRVTGAV